MRLGLAASFSALVALAAPLAPPANAAVSDFRLPPAPSQDEPPPTRQGPVAPDVPESRIPPRSDPTPATSAAPSAVPTAPAIVVPPLPAPAITPEPRATRTTRAPSTPAPAVGDASLSAGSVPERGPVGTDADPTPIEAAGAGAAPPAAAPGSPLLPEPAPVAAATGSSWWVWALLAVAALGALGFLAWQWGRSRVRGRIPRTPEVERPRLSPPASPPVPGDQPVPAPGPTSLADSREPLQLALEPLRLSLTLINATLAYRLEVTNRGATALEGLRIGADMISAHASLSREEQLSGPGPAAAMIQKIERLEPGESRIVKGEFRLPFPQIVPIRQGNAALLMPLARFRLETQGAGPLIRTFVVGQPGPGDGLQPFRLDLGPRVYPRLAQRAFA